MKKKQPCGDSYVCLPKFFRIMRLTLIFILLCSAMSYSAESYSQGAKITLNLNNVTVKEVIKAIEAQSDFIFFYQDQKIDLNRNVSIEVNGNKITEVLDQLFAATGNSYKINDRQIIIGQSIATNIPYNSKEAPQKKNISGTITDTSGKAIPGVSILVKGTEIGTVTNMDGQYFLSVPEENKSLIYSFIGMKKQEIEINGRTAIDVVLEDDISQLQEVTVVNTGYQKISKERAAGSFSTIPPKVIQTKMQTNIASRIEGMVAGMTSYKGKIQIRGVTTLSSSQSAPLYVVDGVPFEGSIDALNPDEIESVTVLKDASAASIYGARSANGVIVIITRNGVSGPMRINVNSSINFTPLPDRGYLNRMSSEELVNFQYDMFNYNSGSYASIDPRKTMNDVYRQLYEKKAGNISEAQLQTILDGFRKNDRYDQVKDELLRKNAMTQQHNLSFSGGSDFYKYNLSVNYLQSNPYEKIQQTSRLGFNFKNNFNLTKWMKADVGILGSNVSSDYNNGFSGYGNLNGGRASYYMLRDPAGQPVQWYLTKTQYEIDRLKSLGLQDETYKPLNEIAQQHYTNSSKYLNINIGTNFTITNGLTLDLRFQKERTENYTSQLYNKNSNPAKTMINDATLIQADGKIINYIPTGGQFNETRGDQNSYTMRAQLNYNKYFKNDNELHIIAGGERRKIISTSTNVYKYGYDESSLNYKSIDELFLSNYVNGTQSIYNQFMLSRAENGFSNIENRFVAFFGNGSYTYKRRLTATASIRMDQSNLFGTDPKYQYKPLWSAGLLYSLFENKFSWLDRLAVRATYGINGNIAKESGPYLIERDYTTTNYYTNEVQAYISSPPNSGLRWEKTKVTNFAVDFKMLKNRLSGSIEYYIKNTDDLLAPLTSDPTIGWSSVTVNYGNMFNHGVDVSLTSENLNLTNLRWRSTLNFNYNKNQLTDLNTASNTVTTYISSPQNRVGVPMGSLYSINYAGLNNLGRPKALKADSTVVTSTGNLVVADLINNGTVTPPFSASLSNTINYKGFELYFMFIFYGGHVMRDVQSVYLSKVPELNYTTNMDRNVLNYWKKAGDELDPEKSPAFYVSAASTTTNLWEARSNNIQKADFCKLRDVILSYSLPSELLAKYYIKGIRFSFQVQNSWYWAANKQHLDPEVWDGTTLSPSRGTHIPATYTLGLSLNF